MRGNIKKAKQCLRRIQEIVAKNPTHIFKMSKEDTIRSLRKTRESIWEEKFAVHH